MSKRLQVLLEDNTYKLFQSVAKNAQLSLGEWVRQQLRSAAESSPIKGKKEKLDGLARALKFNFPVGEIEEINDEIVKGYIKEDDIR